MKMIAFCTIALILLLLASCANGYVNDDYIPEEEPDYCQEPLEDDELAVWDCTPDAVYEQPQLPFLGLEEIQPLIAELNTIEEWIKNITLEDVYFRVVAELATGQIMLYIRSDERWLAGLIIEEDDCLLFNELYYTGGFETTTLPQEFLSMPIESVRFLNFTGMGIAFNIRGITQGTSASEARRAFLDTGDDPYVMYTIWDVDPDANVDRAYYCSPALFIGGEYRAADPHFPNHGYPRELRYSHAIPLDGQYHIHAHNVSIVFPIDENGYIAGLWFSDNTHDN